MSFEEIAARAQRIMPDVLDWVTTRFVQPKLDDLLRMLSRGEESALAAREALRQLRDAGMATEVDFVRFDKLRADLLQAQLGAYRIVVGALQVVQPALIAQVPMPRPLEGLSRTPRTNPGTRGLGTDPVTISISGTTFALGVLALIAAAGVTFILARALIEVSQEVAGVMVAQARADQYKALVDGRLEVYRRCIEAGGDPTTCSGNAQAAVPTPHDSGTETPVPGTQDPLPWVGLGATTALGVVALSGAVYFRGRVRRMSAGTAGVGSVPLRSVARLPQSAPDLDGSKSRYNLEIAGSFAGVKKPRKGKAKRDDVFTRPPPRGVTRAEWQAYLNSDEAERMGEVPRRFGWEDDDE